MKHKHAFVGLLLLLAACTNGPRPDFMPENNAMGTMLAEIHMVESMTRLGYVKSREAAKPFYNQILKKNNLTPDQFDSCITWLSNNRREYEKIYEITMHRLRADKDAENNEIRRKALAYSSWKAYGKKQVNTATVERLWIRLDSLNAVPTPYLCNRHGGRSPYIE